jgi:Pyruvate/2-oxoacid:ferredoxin oxidoreductase gamma subunit
MGSGADTTHETIEHLVAKNKKVGVLKVRMYRPFDAKAFAEALPATVKALAVLDRTKEPGSVGEPLYADVRTAIGEAMHNKWGAFKKYPTIVGGRYGLGSKEFTPAMVKTVFDNLASKQPQNHFTVGIMDDVTKSSLTVDDNWEMKHENRIECMFYGLGSDGTVGANKNSIKIIGDDTPNYAQGYFVYDSKKAGSMTVSHLRFGPTLIRTPSLCTKANFIACHNFSFLEKYDMLSKARKGSVFLLESPYAADDVWNHMPDEVEQQIIDKKIKFYVIDAYKVGISTGMGVRINTTLLDWLTMLGVNSAWRMGIQYIASIIGGLAIVLVLLRSNSLMKVVIVSLLVSYAVTPYALQYDFPLLTLPLFWATALYVRSKQALMGGVILSAFIAIVLVWERPISDGYWIVIGLIALTLWGWKHTPSQSIPENLLLTG